MAEIVTIDPTGNTLYFLVTDSSGDYWNGTAFETYNAANIGTYDVAMTEDGAVGIYRGTFPGGIAAGVYEIVVKRQAGGAPAVADIAVGIATYIWDGTTLRVQSDATAANQVIIKAKVALLGAGVATVSSPVTDDLDVELVRCDDYAGSRVLPWTNAAGTWAGGDLTDATVTFTAKTTSGVAVLAKAGTIVTPTGEQVVSVTLTAAETTLFTAPGKRYVYQLLITKTGLRETEVTGGITVTDTLSPPA